MSERFWIVPLFVTGLCLLAFSVERTILLMLLVTIIVPASILSDFIFPGGFRLQEVMLLISLIFCVIYWIFLRLFNFCTWILYQGFILCIKINLCVIAIWNIK